MRRAARAFLQAAALSHSAAGPSQCEVCRQWARSRLCADCVQRFAASQTRCARCALPLGVATTACGECLLSGPPFEHTVCAVTYAFPWDRLITQFKFLGQSELAAPLAMRLDHAVGAHSGPPCTLVLPVPLSTERLAARGYNQAWELARRVARSRRLPARADLLLRALDTAHQVDLSRAQRQQNLRAAFYVQPALRQVVAGQRVALVDDVMTTGATAREATQALLRAGAAAVDVWVLARTPQVGSTDA
jgi:ComF family protein